MAIKAKPTKNATTKVAASQGRASSLLEQMEELIGKLSFSPETIIEAAMEQPSLFAEMSGLRAEAMREAARAKWDHELSCSEVANAFRHEDAETGFKTTENNIAERVRLEPAIAIAVGKKNETEALEEQSRLLIDAFRMRRDCLRIIADLAGLGIGAEAAASDAMNKLGKVRQQLAAKYIDV